MSIDREADGVNLMGAEQGLQTHQKCNVLNLCFLKYTSFRQNLNLMIGFKIAKSLTSVHTNRDNKRFIIYAYNIKHMTSSKAVFEVLTAVAIKSCLSSGI
jgi:hypothetical protein